MAVALGGVLLAYRALSAVATGVASVMRAVVAAQEIAPLFAAARQDDDSKAAGLLSFRTETDDPAPAEGARVLVQARDLVFRHRPQAEAVLDGCDLTIHRGDRLLLEGSSGGGKSTLASLLVGLRQPESGLLLLDGLDRATLGDAWRRLSTAAPQFHENHVLSGTFAFNLLMGRCWPPSEADLAEADRLCRELGLGELLDRMPSGLMQIVGETGWQLSHGERSRLYLARALLQKAELIVLDESFAALDPDTLDRCLRCALARAPTLLVIAHP
jgi:ATP-binding cassette subfamily B protein